MGSRDGRIMIAEGGYRIHLWLDLQIQLVANDRSAGTRTPIPLLERAAPSTEVRSARVKVKAIIIPEIEIFDGLIF